MNPLVPASALVAALTGSPAVAGPKLYDTRPQPADYQASTYCDFVSQPAGNPDSKMSRRTKCYGISITQRANMNIHFEGALPAARPQNTLITFILAPGAKGRTLSIESIVLSLERPAQRKVVHAKSGRCTMHAITALNATLIMCNAIVHNIDGGRDFQFIGSAWFDEPLSAPIARRFET